MAISPQYSRRWKVIPYSKGDNLNDGSECYITWDEDLEYYIDAVKPEWQIIAAPFDLMIAKHIVELHNEWVTNYQQARAERISGDGEIKCGAAPAVVGDDTTAAAVVHAFGGWFPLPDAPPVDDEAALAIYQAFAVKES